MGINADIQKLEPGALVELFELDASGIGGEVLRFHGYMQVGPIFWQGQRYEPWAIQAEGFEQVGEGQLATLRVGNIGQDAQGRPLAGVISSLCVHLDDLVGARVVARRTLGRYLDAANFPEGNPSADPREELPPEIWIVQQKTLETAQVVEFTLASALDFTARSCPTGPSSPACARGCARAAIAAPTAATPAGACSTSMATASPIPRWTAARA